MAQRSFKLDDDLDARLVKEAERQGRSVSNLIVWAITRELNDSPVFPVESENLRMNAKGEILAKMKSKPVRYEEKRETFGQAVSAEGGTPLPKIARRKQR